MVIYFTYFIYDFSTILFNSHFKNHNNIYSSSYFFLKFKQKLLIKTVDV